MFPNESNYKCRQCGCCCRMIPGTQSKKQLMKHYPKDAAFIRQHWHATVRPLKKNALVPDFIHQRTLFFKCDMIGADNLCRCYEQRPEICRFSPYPRETLLGFAASLVSSDCGYFPEILLCQT